MDLFVINRYTGEETEKSVTDEKENLTRILQKAEERKKLKRKRSKSKEEETVSTPQENISETVNPDSPIKKDIVSDDSDDEFERKISKISEGEEPITGYTILGTEDLNKKQKVKRVLPKWLLNPTVINGSLQNLFTKVEDIVELDSKLKEKLIKNKINHLFPVQAQVIPWILRTSKHALVTIAQDVCVSAPTGSGKTLVFVLSIIQLLKDRCRKALRALVVLPTQSLATQIYNIFQVYAADTGLGVGLIVGDKPFTKEKSELILSNRVWGTASKVDILVCTPGKLIDHLKSTEGFSLDDLEYLIIDEADRVLENVQDDWLHHLSSHIQEERRRTCLNVLTARKFFGTTGPRKLLFSATLSQDPEKLQRLSLFQPKLFTCIVEESAEDPSKFIGKYTTPDELTESCVVCSPLVKPLALYKILKEQNYNRVLIFTGSVETVHRLRLLLQIMLEHLKTNEISSNQSLDVRNEVVRSFTENAINVLVCTDSMARGIDLPDVDCVISYTAAKHIKTYIHRAGRTARAGSSGHSITLLLPQQKTAFFNMLQSAYKQNIKCVEYSDNDLEEFADLYNKALNHIKTTIGEEMETNLISIKKQKKKLPTLRTLKTRKFKSRVKKYVK